MSFERLFLHTICFLVLFPVLGIYVHGGLIVAIGLSIAYALVMSLVWGLLEISWFLTFGISALLTFLLGWLIPAIGLYILAAALPQYLTIYSSIGAIIAGLIASFINHNTPGN